LSSLNCTNCRNDDSVFFLVLASIYNFFLLFFHIEDGDVTRPDPRASSRIRRPEDEWAVSVQQQSTSPITHIHSTAAAGSNDHQDSRVWQKWGHTPRSKRTPLI
jgi:hypothetical protein